MAIAWQSCVGKEESTDVHRRGQRRRGVVDTRSSRRLPPSRLTRYGQIVEYTRYLSTSMNLGSVR